MNTRRWISAVILGKIASPFLLLFLESLSTLTNGLASFPERTADLHWYSMRFAVVTRKDKTKKAEPRTMRQAQNEKNTDARTGNEPHSYSEVDASKYTWHP